MCLTHDFQLYQQCDPNGIRTRATGVKGRRPRPLNDGAVRRTRRLTCQPLHLTHVASPIAKSPRVLPRSGVSEWQDGGAFFPSCARETGVHARILCAETVDYVPGVGTVTDVNPLPPVSAPAENAPEVCDCAPTTEERRSFWGPVTRRSALVAGALGVAALGAFSGFGGSGVAHAVSYNPADYPSWDDVEKARQNESAKAAEIERIE